MTNTTLDKNLRNALLRDIMEFVATKYNTDTLSTASASFSFPVVDEEGNEKFAKVSISIPRGTRNGKGGYDEYDGYAAAEDYRLDLEEKAAKKAANEAKKEAKRKADEEKRAAKKVVKELNEKGLDNMIHESAE